MSPMSPVSDDAQEGSVILERREGGVALLRLAAGKVNALSTLLLEQLASQLEDLADDLPGALVIWGGSRMFSAGADVAELSASSAESVSSAFHRALDKLAGFPRATFAAMNGYALGGGLELALACDFRIAGRSAKVGLPEIQLGMVPGGGGTQRLARLIGVSRAKDMILTGRRIGSEEASAMALVTAVVDDEDVLDEALSRASSLASGPLAAQACAKALIDAGIDEPLPAALAREREAFAELFETADARIGVETFLREGPGRATFTGR